VKNIKHSDDKKQTNLLISFYKALKSFGASLPVLRGFYILNAFVNRKCLN